MAELVAFEKRGAIGVITVNNPPVNALSPGVPEGIAYRIQIGNMDPEVKAMVLIGGGRSFIAGADIRFQGKKQRIEVRRPQDTIEENEKPVVAAIHGFALGGGLEMAMGCHYRIATKSAKVGLPEILIGILPGGGGTQRLPRLIGVAKALDLIVTGRHVPAPEAKELGIIDAVVDDETGLLDAAVKFAEDVADKRPLPRISEMEDKIEEARKDPGMFDAMRKKIARSARNQVAPYKNIEAVEGAVKLPFWEGRAQERALSSELVMGPQSAALRYAFFGEREAQRAVGIGDAKPRPVANAAIVGAGTMGGGIAMSFADFGIPVRVLEASQEALDRGMARMRSTYEASVKRGSLAAAEVDKRMALITPVTSYDQIGDADIVIEAVFEQMDVKKEVFAKLDQAMKPDAVLATNTSALDVDEIATATKRPQSVIGAHFFSPANVMKMLEIVRGAKTAPDIVATVSKLSKAIGKVGVVCGNCDGFVANRSRGPFNTEANILVEQGAMPWDIDRVLVDFGYPMGTFAVGDLAGLDIGYAGRQRREKESPNSYRKLPIADRIVEMGRHGQKTSAGWYRYEKGDRTPHPDPEVEQIIKEMGAELGIPQRTFTDEEILKRLLFASVNEACKILEEGIAARAVDIDIMWLYGFGFPRYKGGLMYWADTVGGAKAVCDQCLAWEKELGERWKPAALLGELAAKGTPLREAKGKVAG